MAEPTGRWVALLRGVNIGGVRIRMAELSDALTASGFESVRTVLASGNVVLTAGGDAGSVAQRGSAGIHERFGYSVAVIVVAIGAMGRAGERYPFPRAGGGEPGGPFRPAPA